MSKRVKAGSSKVAVAYVRVSTDDQKLGPEAQKASVEGWAAREGVTIASWHFDHGVSGACPIEERPGLVEALAALRVAGAGLLVVAKRDRIARDVVIASMVERAACSSGARLVSAAGEGNGETAADAFMRTVIDGAAAYERALIRARTTAALAVLRTNGKKTGGDAPYGYAVDEDGRTLVAVEAEQAVIARARSLSVEGRSLRAVAAALESEGHTSRTSKAFAAQQVSRMLAASAA